MNTFITSIIWLNPARCEWPRWWPSDLSSTPHCTKATLEPQNGCHCQKPSEHTFLLAGQWVHTDLQKGNCCTLIGHPSNWQVAHSSHCTGWRGPSRQGALCWGGAGAGGGQGSAARQKYLCCFIHLFVPAVLAASQIIPKFSSRLAFWQQRRSYFAFSQHRSMTLNYF